MRKSWARQSATGAIVLCAALVPLVFGTGGATSLLEQIFAFGAFAMSYDLLLGYTGIVSFGHAMFFGTGAYAVAIALTWTNGTTMGLVIGFIVAILAAIVLSAITAFLSLRVKDAYFAMITLAVGQVCAVLAGSQFLRPLTNANDGITVAMPAWLSGDMQMYYFCLVFIVIIAIALRRFVHSPIGDVLKGIRENESRARGLGHRIVYVKTLAFMVSGIVAALSGGIFAMSQSFVSTTVYDVSGVSLNVLLMVVIGGSATLYGGVVGAAIILGVQSELANMVGTSPWLTDNFLLFGLLYIIVVIFFPKGILGTIFNWWGRGQWRRHLTFTK